MKKLTEFEKRNKRAKAALNRQTAKRKSYDLVLIVCEGTKTEPIYLNALKNEVSNDTWLLVNTEDCEHRYFHMQAIDENDAKIMISPRYLFK